MPAAVYGEISQQIEQMKKRNLPLWPLLESVDMGN
jgi:hypothetical protein